MSRSNIYKKYTPCRGASDEAGFEGSMDVAFVDTPLHNKKKNTAQPPTRVYVQIYGILIGLFFLNVYREINSLVSIHSVSYYSF